MIQYFPKFKKEEILYSVVCNHHLHTLSSVDQTCIELFSRKNINLHHLFNDGLENLIENVGHIIGLDVERVVRDLTILPVYSHFLSEADYAAYRFAFITKQNGLKLGQLFSTKPYHLKFCPKCNIEDKKNGQELYWRRFHQIPFLPICPIHKCLLAEWSPPTDRIGIRRSFFPASKVLKYETQITESTDVNLNNDASVLYGLLTNRLTEPLTNLTILDRAREVGFYKQKSNGKFFETNQLECFFKYIKSSTSIQSLSHGIIMRWLNALFGSRGRKSINPLLNVQLHSFLQNLPRVKPKPSLGPFECINLFCQSYGNKTIGTSVVFKSGRNKDFVAHKISCKECDMSYCFKEINPSKRWINTYGKVFVKEIRRLSKSGYSIRKISSHTKVNSYAITTLLKVGRLVSEEKRLKDPKNRKIYTYKKKKKTHKSNESKNEKRDKLIYNQLVAFVKKQHFKDYNRKVSRKFLLASIGITDCNTDKFPLTKSFLDSNCESTFEFKIRKLTNFLEKNGNQNLPRYMVRNKFRLKDIGSQKERREVEAILDKYY